MSDRESNNLPPPDGDWAEFESAMKAALESKIAHESAILNWGQAILTSWAFIGLATATFQASTHWILALVSTLGGLSLLSMGVILQWRIAGATTILVLWVISRVCRHCSLHFPFKRTPTGMKRLDAASFLISLLMGFATMTVIAQSFATK